MSERADLRIGVLAPIEGSSSLILTGRPVTDDELRSMASELLPVLLPDIDWEALREAMAWHPRGLGELAQDGSQYRVLQEIEGAACRLLALHDGEDRA